MEGLKGTKTEANLQEALKEECLATVEYSLFANTAGKDGYQQIKDIFLETSGNERIHAKIFLKFLYPDGKIPGTLENLETAANQEKTEGVDKYPVYAKVAKEEGFDEVASEFLGIAAIEQFHMDRYNKLIENIKTNQVFERPEPVIWQCLVCGHLQKTKEAPERCPVCHHPQAYFQILAENY